MEEPDATARYRRIATSVLDAALAAAPETATELGDHRGAPLPVRAAGRGDHRAEAGRRHPVPDHVLPDLPAGGLGDRHPGVHRDDEPDAPGLRFGDPRVMAAMTAIVGFSHLLTGFDNKTLTALMGTLLDAPYTSRHATYDLRRLRRKRLIERIEHTHRYRLTPRGRAVAVLFTKGYGRVLGPGLTALDPALPPDVTSRSPLATAWERLDRELDRFINNGLAAA